MIYHETTRATLGRKHFILLMEALTPNRTAEWLEQIQENWLETYPMPLEKTLERVRLRTQAQMIANEIITAELIFI